MQSAAVPEDVVSARIQCLSISKVLVTIHKKGVFLLVIAYAQLGEAYLSAKCYEQALEHLTTALKLNGSLFQKLRQTRDYHTQILTLLGQCYMEAGNYKDALNLLDKSLSMNKQLQGNDHPSSCSIY